MCNHIISVVIPTYNRADRVGMAIESVLAQTDVDWELIIIDDGSVDTTEDVIRCFKDPRIHYIKQENRGVSAARNRGIKVAHGDLIAFLDSDDRWKPQKLEVQREYFGNHPEISICQTEEIWIRNGRRVNPMKKHRKPSGWIFHECLQSCVVSPSAVMLRRSVFDRIGLFDETLPACEDYDLWLRASLIYEIVTLSPALTIKVGGHADQLSKRWGLDRYRIQALEKNLEHVALSEVLRSALNGQIAERARIVAEGARKRGKSKLYEEYAQKCTPRRAVAENCGMKPPL